MAVSTHDFHELSKMQQDFLLERVTDDETGTRYFHTPEELFRRVWFERLLQDEWVVETGIQIGDGVARECEIPMEAWDIIAKVKAG